MMIHVWDAIYCVLRLVWRTAVQVRHLRPLHAATIIACTGIVIVTPPVPPGFAQPPPPEYTPPPASWSPPDTPIGGYPPAWPNFQPAQGAELTLSPPDLGDRGPSEVVGEATGVQDFRQAPPLSPQAVEEMCETPVIPPPVLPPITVPPGAVVTSPVSEPGASLFMLGMGLAIIGLLRYARPVEPKVRVTILSMEAK